MYKILNQYTWIKPKQSDNTCVLLTWQLTDLTTEINNITAADHLNPYGLHLNKQGSAKLAKNIIEYFKNLNWQTNNQNNIILSDDSNIQRINSTKVNKDMVWKLD